jgi:methionyl-tRNA synthetase
MSDNRVDPSAASNYAVRLASSKGHLEVVRLLLSDARTDPSSDNNYAFRSACELILEVIWDCNKLIDDATPWKLFKSGKTAEVNQLLYSILETVRITAYLLSPIIPQISTEIYRQLCLDFAEFELRSWEHTQWGILKSVRILEEFKPIFQRIESL